MPYYIGDVIKDEKKLIARTPEQFEKSGIRVRLNTGAEEVDGDRRVVRLQSGENLPYDFLVLATGASVTLPPLPGLDLPGVFTLKSLPDALSIKEALRSGQVKKAAVIGAGFIAMEMAEAFRTAGIDTTIIQRADLPVKRWDPEYSARVKEELLRHGVHCMAGTSPKAVEKGVSSPLRVVTDRGEIDTDLLLVATGVKPETGLAARMGLVIGKSGAVGVNFSQETSREGIYAVGDCAAVFHRVSQSWTSLPLGDIANKQGRVAGSNIGGTPLLFPGVVGAQSFKVFDLEVAATGLDEGEAKKSGFTPVVENVTGTPTAGSLSRGEKLYLKIIADRSTGRFLGAQAVGSKGAVSRINLLSAALWSGLRIDEIAYMDLAYSPPFGGAWDPVHIACHALLRKL